MIKVFDICSGIGGFSLGLESTGKYETVAFCENEPFCKKVLNKHWPDVPIYNDLKELGNDPEKIQEEFDLICGGIPCQPFSVAGRKKGKEDDRHLWPYMFEIIKQKTPTWVIVENVGGFVNVALDDVCLDLETEGYATQSFIIPACGIEAPHRRDRVWIIGKNMGDSKHNGSSTPKVSRGTSETSNHDTKGEKKTSEPTGTSESRNKQDMENTRRTLRQGSVERGTHENEVREGDANKLERSSSTPELDVANTNDTGHDRTSECETDGVRQEIDEGRQGQSQSESSGQSSTSGEDVANTNNDGHKGRLSKTCDENATGEDAQGVRSFNTEEFSGRSNDGGDTKESKIDGTLSKSSDGGKGEPSRTTRVCDLSEKSDDSQRASGEDGDKENNSRTLVQEGQSGVQSPNNRGLGDDKTTLEGSEVRQGANDVDIDRVEVSGTMADAKELSGDEHVDGDSKQGNGEQQGIQTQLGGESGYEAHFQKKQWEFEPAVGRVAHGIPDRVDRLKSLGNAIVPQIIYHIGIAIANEEMDSTS